MFSDSSGVSAETVKQLAAKERPTNAPEQAELRAHAADQRARAADKRDCARFDREQADDARPGFWPSAKLIPLSQEDGTHSGRAYRFEVRNRGPGACGDFNAELRTREGRAVQDPAIQAT